MSSRAAGLQLARGLPALLALGIGCQVFVDGALDSVFCSDEGALGPPACPEGFVCKAGACVQTGAADGKFGGPCVDDSDCAPGDLCLDPKLFGGDGQRACARTCCTSRECDPDGDAVCWIPDRGGGGFCRPGKDIGRPRVGNLMAGETCAQSEECRSGICSQGACVDSCCSDTNCAATGASCRLTEGILSKGWAWACQPFDPRQRGYFEPCFDDRECTSGICGPFDGIRRCTIPCCSSETCPVIVDIGTLYNVGCTEISRGDSIIRACAERRPEDAVADVGRVCTRDEECRGGMCVARPNSDKMFCSDVCCTDASCSDPSLFSCRPYRAELSWALRCAPK